MFLISVILDELLLLLEVSRVDDSPVDFWGGGIRYFFSFGLKEGIFIFYLDAVDFALICTDNFEEDMAAAFPQRIYCSCLLCIFQSSKISVVFYDKLLHLYNLFLYHRKDLLTIQKRHKI